MSRLAVLLAATVSLALPGAVSAQQGDPFGERSSRDDGREGFKDARHDDFHIQTVSGDVLMIDGRSGCIWRRKPAGANWGASWVHEFPEGYQTACADRIGAILYRLKEGK